MPDRERELIAVAASQRFVRSSDDRLGLLRIEHAKRDIDARRAALDDQQRPDQGGRYLLRRDAEILERTLCLRAPQSIDGNFDGAEGIALDARLRCGHEYALLYQVTR